ncbi:hypothetical protein JCM6882_009363 [Rhodosporidiobolus microsporus]
MPPPPLPPRPGQQGPPPIPPRPPAVEPPPAAAPPPSVNVPPVPCPPAFPPVCRGKLLADGSAPAAGVLGGVRGVKWQASGILEEGPNLPGQAVAIQRPLTIHMGPPGTTIDGKGRQRTEILSWPPAAASETWIYKWRFHLSGPLPTSSKFFHLTQLLSRESGGFVVALGLVNGKIKISSILPPLLDPMTGAPLPLPEMPAAQYWGRTTYHRVEVKWGPGGFVNYTIQDSVTLETLLQYTLSGVDIPAQGSIKCGLYRAHVCSAATAVVGDFDFKKRS